MLWAGRTARWGQSQGTGALVLLPGSPLNTRSSHLISWVFIFCFIQMKMFAIDTAVGIGGRGSKWDTLEENNLKTRQCYEHRRSCRDEHSAQQPGACVRGTIEQMRKRNWETFFFFFRPSVIMRSLSFTSPFARRAMCHLRVFPFGFC